MVVISVRVKVWCVIESPYMSRNVEVVVDYDYDYVADQNTFRTQKVEVANELPYWYANDFGCTVGPH